MNDDERESNLIVVGYKIECIILFNVWKLYMRERERVYV